MSPLLSLQDARRAADETGVTWGPTQPAPSQQVKCEGTEILDVSTLFLVGLVGLCCFVFVDVVPVFLTVTNV